MKKIFLPRLLAFSITISGCMASQEPNKEYSMLTSSSGLYTQQVVAVNDTFYELIFEQDNSMNFAVYDCSSKSVYNLQNAASNPDCLGILKNSLGGAYPVSDGKRLYVFKTGIVGSNDDAALSYIAEVGTEPNSTNRQVNFPSDVYPDLGGVAFDGKNMYFLAYKAKSKSAVVDSVFLAKLDTTTFALSKVCEIPSTPVYSLVGVYDKGVVLEGWSESGTESTTYFISVIDLSKIIPSMQDTGLSWKQGEGLRIYDSEGHLYIFQNNQASRIDFLSKDEETVISDLSQKLSDPVSIGTGSDFIDGKLIIKAVYKNDQYKYFYFDRFTEEINPLNLILDYEQGPDLAPIVSASDCDYLIYTGDTYLDDVYISDKGSIYTNRHFFLYGRISKTDYWNNAGNYFEYQRNTQ